MIQKRFRRQPRPQVLRKIEKDFFKLKNNKPYCMKIVKALSATIILSTIALLFPLIFFAQNETPVLDSQIVLMKRGAVKDTTYENVASGEFTPGRGFDMVRTKFGTLNISIYAIARYLNQLPGYQT